MKLLRTIKSLWFAASFASLLLRALTGHSLLGLLWRSGKAVLGGLLVLVLRAVRFLRAKDGDYLEAHEVLQPEWPDFWRPRYPAVLWWSVFVRSILEELRRETVVVPRIVTDASLAGFPAHIPCYEAAAENFEGRFVVASVWHVIPWDTHDVATIVNWAAGHGFCVRPLGGSHSWAPLTPAASAQGQRPILAVDTRRLDGARLESDGSATFGAGLTVERAAAFLDQASPRRALPWCPAAGGVTLGGVISIGGHGTGTRVREAGGCTMSELVQGLTAIVWDPAQARYVARSFDRHDGEMRALVLSLGATMITEVRMATASTYNLVALSRPFGLDEYLGGEVGSLKRLARKRARLLPPPTLEQELRNGPPRLELMWLPEQGEDRDLSGLRMIRRGWHAAEPGGTAGSRPYRDMLLNWAAYDTDVAFRRALHGARKRYPDSLGARFQTALWASTLLPHRTESAFAGQLYSTHLVLRYHASGWCLIVQDAKLPAVLRALAMTAGQAQRDHGRPFTGPIEVRITDVDPDGPTAVALSPARKPASGDGSVLRAVWFSILTDLVDPSVDSSVDSVAIPTTEQPAVDQRLPTAIGSGVAGRPTSAGKALRDVERWLLDPQRRPQGLLCVRPEWAKGFAYDAQGVPWMDPEAMAAYRAVFDAFPTAPRQAVGATLDALDPARLFRSPLAQQVLR